MIYITVALIYLVYVIGLGLLIVGILGQRRNTFLIAYGAGISVLILTQVPFRFFGGEVIYWYVLVHGSFVALILLALAVRGIRGGLHHLKIKTRRHGALFGAFVVAVCFSVYHIWVGPYTEIPSDFWARLSNVKDQLIIVRSGSFPAVETLADLVDDTAYVPFLHAVVAHEVGMLPLWLVAPVTLVTSLCFLLATYWFTLRLVARVRITRSAKIAVAMLAVTLTLLTLGVAAFSYVRYYAYFPHILNATLMLTVLSLFLDFQERKNTPVGILLLISIFLLVMGLVNQQEALMTVVLMFALSLWKAVNVFRSNWRGSDFLANRAKLVAIVSGALAVLVMVVVFSSRNPGVWGQPHLIDMGVFIPFLSGLPVANPSIRFWDALGLFGIVTYAWYFLRWEWFQTSDYIRVAMASPLYTLFNPLFVLWLISIASWDPLWRFSFLMPLSITSAYLIVFSMRGTPINRKSKKRYLDYLMFGCLMAAIVPFNSPQISNTNTRLPSLLPVNESNGVGLWADLIRYLDEVPVNYTILTDYVTNYVLTAALRHNGTPNPKSTWQKKVTFFTGNFKDKLLYYGVDDRLLIINNRDGKMSVNGRLSGHWPESILKVSRIYPEKLKSFLEAHPSDFHLMWENNQIWIYQILRDPTHY